MRSSIALVLLLLASLLAGCAAQGVHLATAPPGARVIVDGKDSGFVTPCVLSLDEEDENALELVLPGYQPARRVITDDLRAHFILWPEMLIVFNTWHFPLWLNVEDGFIPLKVFGGKAPNRIFVRLQREADR